MVGLPTSLLGLFLARAAAIQTLDWGESIINTSHPWYIVSTSGSRMPNEGLYIGINVFEPKLAGWEFDYNNPDNKMAFWLWPAGDEADLFYLVTTKDSRVPGYMLYLDNSGNRCLWPFHPDTRDWFAEWKLIPDALHRGVVKSPDDTPAYFIVSGSNQRAPNVMLYVGEKPGGANTPAAPALLLAPSPPAPSLPPPLPPLAPPTTAPTITTAAARDPLPRTPPTPLPRGAA